MSFFFEVYPTPKVKNNKRHNILYSVHCTHAYAGWYSFKAKPGRSIAKMGARTSSFAIVKE